MNAAGHFDTPQAAYDWASRYFNQGGFQFVGHQPWLKRWYILTAGGFCVLSLEKKQRQA